MPHSPKGWITVKTNAGRVTGYNQNHSFYGAWIDDGKQMTELSYQGQEATNIPKTGKAVITEMLVAQMVQVLL